jgi:hypothetical protein
LLIWHQQQERYLPDEGVITGGGGGSAGLLPARKPLKPPPMVVSRKHAGLEASRISTARRGGGILIVHDKNIRR